MIAEAKAAHLETVQFPDFYMEDFSIQAFAVSQYGQALEVLRRAGYNIVDKGVGVEISIDHAGELGSIHVLLRHNGIKAELTDIADTIYQA